MEMIEKILKDLLLVPMRVIEQNNDQKGTSKVRVVTVERNSKRYVPAFLDEEILFEWAKENHSKIGQGKTGAQCIPIIGEDLVLMLDANGGIILNPDSKNEQIFDTEALKNATDNLFSEKIELPKKKRELIPDIKDLKTSFPEIEELYFKDDESHNTPVLTFVHKELTPEKRFKLIEQIANISKFHFGEAGFIDVWDDKIDQAQKIRSTISEFEKLI